MESKTDILNKLRELKPIFFFLYAVRRIGLFGSFADNSADENSDNDLLVELDKPIGWKFFSLDIYIVTAKR